MSTKIIPQIPPASPRRAASAPKASRARRLDVSFGKALEKLKAPVNDAKARGADDGEAQQRAADNAQVSKPARVGKGRKPEDKKSQTSDGTAGSKADNETVDRADKKEPANASKQADIDAADESDATEKHADGADEAAHDQVDVNAEESAALNTQATAAIISPAGETSPKEQQPSSSSAHSRSVTVATTAAGSNEGQDKTNQSSSEQTGAAASWAPDNAIADQEIVHALEDANDADATTNHSRSTSDDSSQLQLIDPTTTAHPSAATHALPLKANAPDSPTAPLAAEAAFSDANHPQIITALHGQLLPNGGSMQIRLDPPSLGVIQLSVEMKDGALTASFQTSNDDATRLLSHSLGQLKTALESQGVSVEKLQVQQAPREHDASNRDGSQQSPSQESSAQQEQQRREMLQRLWRRARFGRDSVDYLA
jgi:flagellar hook-length control protein FliK